MMSGGSNLHAYLILVKSATHVANWSDVTYWQFFHKPSDFSCSKQISISYHCDYLVLVCSIYYYDMVCVAKVFRLQFGDCAEIIATKGDNLCTLLLIS